MSPDAHERQFQAYQTLNKLNDALSETMKMIAYGQLESIDWQATCNLHREVFEKWIAFVEFQRILGMNPAPLVLKVDSGF